MHKFIVADARQIIKQYLEEHGEGVNRYLAEQKKESKVYVREAVEITKDEYNEFPSWNIT